jgi:DNA polymerase-4
MERWSRISVHADMDAFYAAVEQLDDPALRGRPVLVGPRSHRGVVLTASYEARPFGVGSAMPMARAIRLCPGAVVVPPRFDRYQELSRIIMTTFADFSPRVEAISLDEAFIDMTGAEKIFGPPREMGAAIKRAVREATGGLAVSVGISGTKYVAKVASAGCKPDGLEVVPPDRARAWLAPQSVARLWGAGPRTQERLRQLGFRTIGDVAAADPSTLVAALGKIGHRFAALARAIDPRVVEGGHRARSIGSERTLGRDVSDRASIARQLRRSADDLARRLRRKSSVALGVRVKLKTSAFELLTRQRQLAEPTDVAAALFAAAVELLDRFEHPGPFRLVGMAVYDLANRGDPVQLELAFPEVDATERRRRIETTLDGVVERFGRAAIARAGDLADGVAGRVAPNLDFLDDD